MKTERWVQRFTGHGLPWLALQTLLIYWAIALVAQILILSIDTPETYRSLQLGYVCMMLLVTTVLVVWLVARYIGRAQQSDARYRQLVEQATDGIFVCDLAGNLEDVNAASCAMLGYTREELLQRTVADVIDPDDLAASPLHLERLSHGQSVTSTRRLLSRTERPIIVEINARQFEAGRIMGIVRDVTTRHEMEAALRASEAQLRALIDALSDVIIVLDAQGTYLQVAPTNPSALIAPTDQLLGRTLAQVLPPDKAATYLEAIQRALQTHSTISLEYELVIDHKPRWFTANVSPVSDDRVVWVARDVTDIRLREQGWAAAADLADELRVTVSQAEVLPLIVEQIRPRLNVEAVALGIINSFTEEVVLKAAYGVWEQFISTALPVGQGVAAILRTGSMYANNNIADDPRIMRPQLLQGVSAVLGVPLIADHGPLGMLVVGRTTPFTEEDSRLLSMLANIAAGALQRAVVYDQARRRAEQLATLNTIGRTLAELLDLSQIFEQLAAAVQQIFPDMLALLISRFDAARQIMTCIYGSERGQLLDISKLPPAPLEPLGHGAQSESIHLRQPVIVKDLPARLKRTHTSVLLGEEALSAIYVPLLAKGDVIGVVQVQSSVYNRFTTEDAEVLSLLAGTAAISIQNARLFEAERRQLRLAHTLQAVGALLTAGMSLDEVFDYVFDLLAHVVRYDSVSIQLLSEGQILFAAGRGFTDMRRAHEIVRESLLPSIEERWGEPHQRVMVISDTEHDPRWYPLPGSELIRSWVGAALRVKGRLLGILNVDSITPNAYDEATGETVAAFANQAAMAIENAQLHDAVRRHAEELEGRVANRTLELERERKRTAAILDAAGEGIIFTNLKGNIEYMNAAMERLTGFTVEEALGQNSRLWQSGTTPVSFYQKMWHTISHGEIWRGELVNRRKEGTLYDAALTIAPVFDIDGQISGYVGVQSDISHQKELDRLKDEFVSNVSHELRTPIANVKLYISLLTRGKPEKYDEYLQTLRREAARLEKLIEDLLELSRLDLGRQPVWLTPTDVNQLAAQLIGDRTALAAGRQLLIDYRAESPLPFAQADPTMLSQVVSNLLTNAINYTAQGGVITVATAARAREEQTWITITIQDTGPGISQHDRAHIFERFYRGEAGRKSGTPGTGLGLAISIQIMNQLGGSITEDSQPGEGAAFTVWLKPAEPA